MACFQPLKYRDFLIVYFYYHIKMNILDFTNKQTDRGLVQEQIKITWGDSISDPQAKCLTSLL